nr:hypothetical protein CFP56_72906 [Quercus suber]
MDSTGEPYHLGHYFASSWCFPQVWLQGRVLDLFVADHSWLYPWDTLCSLYYHQVMNFNLCGVVTCERQYVVCFSDLGFVYRR